WRSRVAIDCTRPKRRCKPPAPPSGVRGSRRSIREGSDRCSDRHDELARACGGPVLYPISLDPKRVFSVEAHAIVVVTELETHHRVRLQHGPIATIHSRLLVRRQPNAVPDKLAGEVGQ